jgi:hypothetical protein
VVTHAGEDVGGERLVPGSARHPKRVAEVTAGGAVPAAVIGHHARPPGEDRRRSQQLPPDAVAVDAVQQRYHLSPQVLDDQPADVAAAVAVIHEPEQLGVGMDASYVGVPDVAPERRQDPTGDLRVLAVLGADDALPVLRMRIGVGP